MEHQVVRATDAVVPDIEFRNVSKWYGQVKAVDGIDLTIPKGSFMSLLGPSGCGKTTCLRMMAGFEQPTSGEVLIQGQDVTGVPAYRRPINMVFQHYALFPHLNVADNVSFGLRQRTPKPSPSEIAKAVAEALEMVRLKGYEQRKSYELSGGQQQRVALARALINRPAVLLLDEPLAALDRKLRREMQIELQTLQRDVGITFLLVTHDQEEAMSMSDTIAIMREGKIVQTGSPRELYDEPVNSYVADFVGKSNFFRGRAEQASHATMHVVLDCGIGTHGQLPATAHRPQRGEPVVLSVRPEQISIARLGPRGERPVGMSEIVRVKNRIFLGEHTEYLVEGARLGAFMVLSPRQAEEAEPLAIGEAAVVSWNPSAALVLAAD
ncbi:MAG: ABC transporter ATP-binding protein [Hyphomicrobiales bacterium]